MSTNLAYYEEDVIRLYIDEGKNAEDTIKCLNEQHGTAFTVRQFKGKFNGLKNLSAREWREISREICDREAKGLGSDVYLYGRRQDPERVTRALRRYGKEKEGAVPTGIDLSARKHGRQRIEIRNPDAQNSTQGAGIGSSAVPHSAERLATPRSLHLESVIDPSSIMFNNGFGMSADDQELDFYMEGIELDAFGEFFGTAHCSSSHITSLADVEHLDMESLLQTHRDVVAAGASTGEPSGQPWQLALRHREDSPLLTTCSGSRSFSTIIGTTNGLEDSFRPLIVSPGIPSEMLGIRTENLLETGNPTNSPSWPSWGQVHGRVQRGEPGWLASTLIGADPKLEHLTSVANLVEKVFTYSRGDDELRFDGHDKDSMNQMFAIVIRLVLNRSLSEEQLLRFIYWIVEEGQVNGLYGFLRKGSPETGTFIDEVLRVLSNEVLHFPPRYPWGRENFDREGDFITIHPLEAFQLIRIADARTLSGSLGGSLLIRMVELGNLEMVKTIVSANSANVNYAGVRDIMPMTPLCAAVRVGSAEIVCYLIDKGANINTRTQRNGYQTTALVEAVPLGNVDMVQLLLDAGSKLFHNLRIGKHSILEYAKRNRPAIYEQLQGIAESKLDSDIAIRSFLLVEAAENGNHSLSQFFLQHGNVRHGALESALSLAVKKGNVSAVRTLLHRGIDPNALEYRRTDHVEHYDGTDQDSDSDEEDFNFDDEEDSDSDGISTQYEENSGSQFDSTHPIHLAICGNTVSPDILYLLIKAGASITSEGLSRALCCAVLSLHDLDTRIPIRDKCLLLSRLQFHVSVTNPVALEMCAYLGSIEECDSLLDTGTDINAYGIVSNALQAAARHGHLALVQHLLEQGASVNVPANLAHEKDRQQCRGSVYLGPQTALQGAVLGGYDQVVNCLIEAGAKVAAPPIDNTDITILDAAAEALSRKYYDGDDRDYPTHMFRKLLAHGALINRTDGGPCGVLHHLVHASQFECLELALKERAATEERAVFRTGRNRRLEILVTPIQLAAARHNMEMVELLLKYNADINTPASDTKPGRTALQAAIESQGHTEKEKETEDMVVFLLQHHADVNARAGGNFGRTALQAATTWKEPSMRIVSLLLQHKADVNAPPAEAFGLTALQGAAISGDVQIAKMLLAHGAHVNAAAAPREGRTAIQGAAEHGRLDMVRLLLDNGAMPGPDEGFSKAIEFAEKNHRYHIAHLLRDHEDAYNGLATGFSAGRFRDFGGPSSGILNELTDDNEIGM
ncbi:ankyrin repeat-containing domain protein [Ilyonectria sp. MPI-CAGE-AT-0026]|nr:ankyrin repeat-containing domain protein [Ilyonectria sp. MPI-CAGE-AT-0026]